METKLKREIFKSKLKELLGTTNNDNISIDNSITENSLKQKQKIVSTSVYDNRYQAQKDILISQKATIAEQKQIIDKLKILNTSLENEVTYLKGLMKNLKGCTINSNRDHESLNEKIIINPPKDPDILLRMKKREEERKKRWQYIKDQKANNERIKKVMIAEKEEEERFKAIDEKRRKEREEVDRMIAVEEEKKRKKTKKLQAVQKLKIWQNKNLVYTGFWKWTLYIKLIHAKRDIVKYRIWKIMTWKCFQNWRYNAYTSREMRILQARNHYIKILKRKVVHKWIKFTARKKKIKAAIGSVLNNVYLHKLIIFWKLKSKQIITRREIKMQLISERYQRYLKSFYFNKWKELPKKMQEKREQEHRLRAWHSKVKEILPDFDAE